ncbi:MAG: ATP-binding protein, partial [Myxococcota bacterium]
RLRTVGTLASGLAHELGTPLHCVAGYAQLIEERPDIDAEARESAGVIRQQAARMSAIIRQLLGFARAQPAPAEGGADPAEVFHSVLGMLKPPLKKAGSSVEHDLGDLPEVAIDAAGLSQVLTNILINAVHATGANASKDPIRVTSAVWEDVVMLRVEDSGVGMEQEVLKRVFDPFFTTKDVGEGTGLGLSVAYGIVAEAGGRIELESEPAAGTRVSLYLPRFPGAPLLEAAV